MSNTKGARISIVTPCFNHARFVAQTMKSVLDQDYPELEYVVIDGGSTDGSREIIERYAPRLAHWVSEPDRGHGHAINKGFSHTTGEIMAWLNSDDMYLPWTLRTVAEIFETHPEVKWITGINSWWDDLGRLTHAEEVLKNQYDFLLGRYGWIQQESTFWRRSLWDAAGGGLDESYRMMVDGELWTRFFAHAPLYHVRCVLGGFRSWGANRSILHVDECHAEMHRAIEVMRHDCDEKILRNAAVLKRAVGTVNLLRGFPARQILRRMMAGTLEDCGYQVLEWEAGKWQKHCKPFFL